LGELELPVAPESRGSNHSKASNLSKKKKKGKKKKKKVAEGSRKSGSQNGSDMMIELGSDMYYDEEEESNLEFKQHEHDHDLEIKSEAGVNMVVIEPEFEEEIVLAAELKPLTAEV
jgi:hypothetical protein